MIIEIDDKKFFTYDDNLGDVGNDPDAFGYYVYDIDDVVDGEYAEYIAYAPMREDFANGKSMDGYGYDDIYDFDAQTLEPTGRRKHIDFK